MNYNYLKNSHNKIFKREKFIYKFFKSNRKYLQEKSVYLNYNFDFIPRLYYFSDNRKLLIIENVGQRIKKKNINFIELKKINDIMINNNLYHNDYRAKNILYSKLKNKYYFIDFEYADIYYNDYRKSPLYDDIRPELFTSYTEF